MDPTTQNTEQLLGVSSSRVATSEDVRVWLAGLKTRRNSNDNLVAHNQQCAAVNEVAHRVTREFGGEIVGDVHVGEPLRELVQGPGTGKTHVIKLSKELCEDILGWDQGIQLQVVAFQAAMAHLISGDTSPPTL